MDSYTLVVNDGKANSNVVTVNLDVPVSVTKVTQVLKSGKLTSVVVTFSQALIMTSAQRLSNFFVLNNGTPQTITSAVYSTQTHTVTLTLQTPIAKNKAKLLISTDPATGVTNLAGDPLLSNNSAGNYIVNL